MTESFLTQRPEPDEYQPFYAGYIATAPDGSILATLEEQRRTTVGLLAEFDEATGNFRYAPGKWSVKEVLGHLVDSERVFAGRALAFARADRGHCPGMDQDAWVSEARFDRRRLTDLVDDFDAVRVATIRLFAGLAEDEWPRRGIGSGVEFSVRALAWIIAGHERHHVTVLRERYLSARP
jgi:hypothetical protein